jgi:hypothetical protein
LKNETTQIWSRIANLSVTVTVSGK